MPLNPPHSMASSPLNFYESQVGCFQTSHARKKVKNQAGVRILLIVCLLGAIGF
ncbi:MAG: hypothetical protein ACI9X4_000285 [Glaciecola sp.]|jgi:hypothetical protein